MPVSSAQKEANRKKNLAEARTLLQSGKSFEDLAPHHQTAINRTSARAVKKDRSSFSKIESGITTEKLTSDSSVAKPKGPYSKMSSLLKEGGQPFAALGEQSRDLKSNPQAINSDDTHHAQMRTVGDYLSEKLNTAHDSGILPSSHAKEIDKTLTVGHNNLEKSDIAHDKGDVAGAKHHMTEAGNAYYSAAVQMHSRGAAIKPDVHKIAQNISSAYVTSRLPGTGSSPHENFVSRAAKPLAASSQAEKEPNQVKSKTIAKLSKSFEEDRPDINTSHYGREPEETSSSVWSRQIQNYMDGR